MCICGHILKKCKVPKEGKQYYLRVGVALVILFVHFEEGREALEDTPNECIFQLMACIQDGIINIIQEVPIQPQQMLDRGKDRVNLQARASVKSR